MLFLTNVFTLNALRAEKLETKTQNLDFFLNKHIHNL